MNQDLAWMLLRSLLLASGGYLVARGYLTEEQVPALVGAMGVLFTLAWQTWIKWNTRLVPEKVIENAKVDTSVPTIPTVSAATGNVS